MLTTLGLDAASEAVYRAMLAHPHEGVAALSKRLGLTATEIRQSLDMLSELALIRPSCDQHGAFHAVSPDVGLELLMARQREELAAQQQRIEASRVAAAQLIAEFAHLHPSISRPGVDQMVGLDEIRDRIAALARHLRTEIMTFAPGGGHKPESIEASKPHDQNLLERGIRMRTVYLDSVRNDQRTVAYVNWLAERGGEVRTVGSLPIRMILFDRATAVIPVSSDDTAAGAVVLTGEGMLTALCALFENVWVGAQPLSRVAARDDRGLSAQNATVVRLLAEGYTDEAIAKRLGVSPRTARRLATELMERLGARSRFEAGVRAVQQGWLPSQA
ncbi:LuxR C-terminal-related transcriptional regulator [Streptomyces sp. NPDC002676]